MEAGGGLQGGPQAVPQPRLSWGMESVVVCGKRSGWSQWSPDLPSSPAPSSSGLMSSCGHWGHRPPDPWTLPEGRLVENSRHSPVSPPFHGCLANLLVLSVGAGLCSGQWAGRPPRGPERGRDAPCLCFSGVPCLGGWLCSGERAGRPPRGPERGPDTPRLCFSRAPRLGTAAHGTHTRGGCELRRLRRDRPSTVSAHEEERLPALGPGLACMP